MQKLGFEIWMLSGDNEITTKHIADVLGIKNVISNILPSGKSNLIKQLQLEGKTVESLAPFAPELRAIMKKYDSDEVCEEE